MLIAKKLSQKTLKSPAPGNDGMTLMVWNWWISLFPNILNWLSFKANDTWSFHYSDDALAAGIVDEFAAGLKAFGPTKAAAELEWSSDFAKENHGQIRCLTAAYGPSQISEEAKAYIEEKGAPIVVKADGLALWERCRRCWDSRASSRSRSRDALDNKLGTQVRVVIEEFLQESEFSLFAFVNGDKFYIMPTASGSQTLYDRTRGPTSG